MKGFISVVTGLMLSVSSVLATADAFIWGVASTNVLGDSCVDFTISYNGELYGFEYVTENTYGTDCDHGGEILAVARTEYFTDLNTHFLYNSDVLSPFLTQYILDSNRIVTHFDKWYNVSNKQNGRFKITNLNEYILDQIWVY